MKKKMYLLRKLRLEFVNIYPENCPREMKSYIVKIPLGNLKLTIASVLGDQSKLGLEQYDKVPEKVQNSNFT